MIDDDKKTLKLDERPPAEEIEVVNLNRFTDNDDAEIAPKSAKKKFHEVINVLITPERVMMFSALLLSIAALVFAVSRTELTIGQGQLYIEDASVNEMLGNLLQNDLAAAIPNSVGVRDISVRVEIHGGSEPTRVSDICSDVDRVTAQVVFFPQRSVAEFAADVRRVLDVMLAQSRQHDFEYDEIEFVARDTLTNIRATLSARLSPAITAEQIASITYYFGEIAVTQGVLPDFVG
jgi:hypothetical protein